MKVSPPNDRHTLDVGQSQVGFIDALVTPLYELLIEALPKMSRARADMCVNRQRWCDAGSADLAEEDLEDLEEDVSLQRQGPPLTPIRDAEREVGGEAGRASGEPPAGKG